MLKNYEGIGIKTNLYRIFNHGTLKGTGKLIILATDQGFEHGPDKMFSKFPEAYDPHHFFKIAINHGLNAFAAPLGILEAGAEAFLGQVPLILKLNSSNNLQKKGTAPDQAITSTVKDALRLGCTAVGFTLYPGSDMFMNQLEEMREIAQEARAVGLPLIAWSYARGGNLTVGTERALDVISYGAHMACLAGAHVVKVKLPTSTLALPDTNLTEIKSLSDRVRHVVRACFNGKRIVIFSGGEVKNDQELIEETHAIQQGGGFGSIVGRNFFQRSEAELAPLVREMQSIYTTQSL